MPQSAISSTCEPVPAKWVDRIFAELGTMYGSKFADQWGGQNPDQLKAYWAQRLAGYSPAELRRGLDACLQRDWPPTLPEFLKLCRPPVTPTVLWYEAQAAAQARDAGEVGQWSAPWVYHAWREMAHELRTGEFAKHGERWRFELERAKQRVERGELPAEIPAPAAALSAPEPPPLNREEAAQRAAQLRIHVPRPVRAGREWARRLLARVAAGEKLPVAHVAMAKSALRAELETSAGTEEAAV